MNEKDNMVVIHRQMLTQMKERIAALERALQAETARADKLAAALDAIVIDKDGYLFVRTYGQTEVVVPRELWSQIRAALSTPRAKEHTAP